MIFHTIPCTCFGAANREVFEVWTHAGYALVWQPVVGNSNYILGSSIQDAFNYNCLPASTLRHAILYNKGYFRFATLLFFISENFQWLWNERQQEEQAQLLAQRETIEIVLRISWRKAAGRGAAGRCGGKVKCTAQK